MTQDSNGLIRTGGGVMSRTYFGLLAEFGASEIRLVDCCEKYFSLNQKQAKRRAAEQLLPVKAYRATPSQKGEWLISADDLAAHLDAQKRQAEKLFSAAQGFRGVG